VAPMTARKTCWWWTGADEEDILSVGDRGSKWERVVVSLCMDCIGFPKFISSNGHCVMRGELIH